MFFWRVFQALVAGAVACGAIYFQQQTNYHINPYIVGAWGLMAAYGATWLVAKVLDWFIARSDGFRLPPSEFDE